MKAYINNETGSGKTLFSSILALLYSELNPTCKIYANYHINLYDKETNKPKVIYTQFSLLPFSEIEKGNCLIILDDFYAIKNADYYSGILAVLSRKTKMEIILTIQYYTDLTKRVRKLCHFEIQPFISNLDIYENITEKSTLNLKWYRESNETLILDFYMSNIYNLLNYGKNFDYTYIPKEMNLYNTNEVVSFGTESKLIKEVAKFSNNFSDVEMNCSIISKNRTEMKRLINQVCKLKGIENWLNLK